MYKFILGFIPKEHFEYSLPGGKASKSSNSNSLDLNRVHLLIACLINSSFQKLEIIKLNKKNIFKAY